MLRVEPAYSNLSDHERLLREVRGWNESRVADWLSTVNSSTYANVFVDNHINGDALLECDQQALKELGVTKVGDRIRIHVAIKTLRSKCFGITRPVSITSLLAASPRPHSPGVSPTSGTFAGTPLSATSQPALANISPARRKSPGADDVIESPLRSASTFSSLLSNCVKFIGEEGQTRIVNIVDCTDTSMILEKALKKFGLCTSTSTNPAARIDNYCVFITADVGPAKQLDDEELLEICQDPNRPERERLILKRKDTAPSIAEFKRAQKIADEQHELLKDQAMVNNITKFKKIGGFFGEMPSHIRGGSGSTASPLQSPVNLTYPRGPKARIKEFFGGRPPSELISSNLQDYFPETSTLVLEKTVRNSIRRSQRMSVAARGSYGGRRFSNSSLMSIASQRSMNTIPTVGDAWISATAKRKERTGLLRSPSVLSSAETVRSRRSVKSVRADGPPSYAPSIRSARSRKSVRIETTDGASPVISYSDSDVEEDEEEKEKQNEEDIESAVDEDDDYELPEYLQEELLSTELEDEEDLTLHASDLGSGNDSDDLKNTKPVHAEDTGPSSWIKGTLIGQGSFGSVVLGMNALTGELMAVKQVDLPSTSIGDRDLAVRKTGMLDALQREIALLRDLQHDNIVQYLGSNSDDTHLNIFLEYVPGGSVTEMLTKYGAFKEPLVRQFVRQILTGLNYLHEREIIHRDIKGGNILVDNKGVIKISDFGISKKVDSNMLSMHESVSKAGHRPSLQGSVYWMAPEVVKQTQYTRKADIWSLGCLIVEMLTGQHPYPEFNQMQAIFKIGGSDSAPDIPESISKDGRDFLNMTFELDYLKRPSAAELLAHKFTQATVA